MTQTKFGLNATTLRVLALVFMLLDHLWATVMPGSQWMTMVGRLAFPIFAFQAAEGYHHTHDFKAYRKRLLIFALISEIPYNLLISDVAFWPFQQNVMFTLLLGVLACKYWDEKSFWKLALVICLGFAGFVDYGWQGVVSVLMFHVFRGKPWLQLVGLAAINILGFKGQMLEFLGLRFHLQSLAVLAWPLIALYNGEKGPGGKKFQYASYLFYPIHALILGLL